jgi:nitroreductase
MNVIQAIRTKRAVRNYRTDPLPGDVVRTILDAGRRAQSAKNDQPWEFIAIRERSVLQDLSATSLNVAHIARSALTVAIVTPPPSSKETILFDAGQSAAYMQLAAWELGVVSCLATIWESEQARNILEFPDDMHLRLAIAFGYPTPEDAKPRAARKGGRRTLEDTVRWDRW